MEIITSATQLLELLTGKPSTQPVIESNAPPCPKCGLSIKEFNISGKFGCPYCYTHYKDEVKAISKRHQHSCQHVGKSPERRHKKYEEQLKVLKLRLARARELERNDEVKQLKEEIANLIKDNQ